MPNNFSNINILKHLRKNYKFNLVNMVSRNKQRGINH